MLIDLHQPRLTRVQDHRLVDRIIPKPEHRERPAYRRVLTKKLRDEPIVPFVLSRIVV